MYVLGDMIDKGKGSIRLLKYVMGKPNVHCIMGNHEHNLLYEYYSSIDKEEFNKNCDSELERVMMEYNECRKIIGNIF
jgi:hypothetical protein